MTNNNLKMITNNGKKYNKNITKLYLYNEKLTQRNKEALSNLTQLTELILYLNNKNL